jgi:thiamine pyrophosphate-dependent acetolactate synthase large subunit-like protein
MVRSAFKQARTERPGAVYLAFPQDVETSPAPEGYHPLEIKEEKKTKDHQLSLRLYPCFLRLPHRG